MRAAILYLRAFAAAKVSDKTIPETDLGHAEHYLGHDEVHASPAQLRPLQAISPHAHGIQGTLVRLGHRSIVLTKIAHPLSTVMEDEDKTQEEQTNKKTAQNM